YLLDLGTVPIPVGTDPVTVGPVGVDQQIPTLGIQMQLWASRPSGTGNLDWDYLVLIPADDRLAIVSTGGPNLAPATDVVHFDGTSEDIIYYRTSTGDLRSLDDLPQIRA